MRMKHTEDMIYVRIILSTRISDDVTYLVLYLTARTLPQACGTFCNPRGVTPGT